MDEQKFIYFIENSSIEYYNKGNNGIILLAILNENIVSPYSYKTMNKYNKPVNKIALKLVFITNEKEADPIILSDDFDFDQKTEEEFIKEVNSQVDIYLQSVTYLEPICPQIFYSNIYKNKFLLECIIKKTKKKELNSILLDYEENIDKFGIIIMEFMNNKALYYYKNYNSYSMYKNMGRYLILRLALETGYTHSDFHTANILIETNYSFYFHEINGKPLLIDFTWAEKIPEDKMILIKEYCEKKKYKDALLVIANIPRTDSINLNEYEDFNWITKDISYKISDNNIIDQLFNRRKFTIKKMSEFLNEKNNSEIEYNYPQIPISENIKNNIYQGLKI
jgi:hypothetical protein